MSELSSAVAHLPILRGGSDVRHRLSYYPRRDQLPLAGTLDHHLRNGRGGYDPPHLAGQESVSPMVRLEARR